MVLLNLDLWIEIKCPNCRTSCQNAKRKFYTIFSKHNYFFSFTTTIIQHGPSTAQSSSLLDWSVPSCTYASRCWISSSRREILASFLSRFFVNSLILSRTHRLCFTSLERSVIFFASLTRACMLDKCVPVARVSRNRLKWLLSWFYWFCSIVKLSCRRNFSEFIHLHNGHGAKKKIKHYNTVRERVNK